MIELAWTDSGFAAVATSVAACTGLLFPPVRRLSVERSVRETMARAGVTDLRVYSDLLARDGALLDDLVTELTIGETFFFREPLHFAFVRERVLPEVLGRRGPGQALRMWSAGCATGEEAYSLAILLEDAQLPKQPYILATDISRLSLKTAQAAIYRGWSLRGVPTATIERYFRKHPGADDSHIGARYDLDTRFCDRVTFAYLNLALDLYPAIDTGTCGMDLIFCRNVLIYLDRQTISSVADRLRRSLATGGWIVTASTDPLLSEYTDLEPTRTDWGIFYRQAKKKQRPLGRTLAADALVRPAHAPPRGLPRVARPALTQRPLPIPVTAQVEVQVVTTDTVLAQAKHAAASGAYRQAAEALCDLGADDAACALRVRALANLDVTEAERACSASLERHPFSVELHYLHAVLLVALGHLEGAMRPLRRIVYLDAACAIGYFTLGDVLRRTGDLAGARRAYRNARDLLASQPADAVVPLSHGEHAGRLAELAAIEFEKIPEIAHVAE